MRCTVFCIINPFLTPYYMILTIRTIIWGSNEKLYSLNYTKKRIPNWSILKETSPGYSLEGLMLRLKLQYFGHLMRRADSLEKTRERLKAGGEGDDRG